MATLCIILAFAVLNRIRGGGLGAEHLPGHPRFWVLPVVLGLAYWHLGAVEQAVWFAAAWLLWSTQPWGDVYMMGRPHPSGQTYDWSTCAIGLMMLGILPMFLIAPLGDGGGWPFAVVLRLLSGAVALSLAYELGWQAFERRWIGAHTVLAEPLIGLWWGAVLVSL